MLYEFSDDYSDDEKFVADEKYKKYNVMTRSLIEKAKEELMKKAMTHVRKASDTQIFKLEIMKRIPDEVKIELFEEYADAWDLNHQNLEKVKKVAKELSTAEKLEKYVIEHMDDNLMSFEEFIKVIKSWKLGNKTRKAWYDEYKKLYFNQPGKTIEIKETVKEFGNGFKRKRGMEEIKNNEIKNHFNLKDNKKYHLHTGCSWYLDN